MPHGDPTLLFTNAGMNQFKDVFLGTGSRDYKRAADTQKCIRVSGKHNDLEEVGHDTYHHTFFEMLGNWSFGDYYKKEAIKWAWELLTEVWKLPKERIWATVYKTDDEALELWKSETDIKHDHILKFAEKDNFWEMGDTGPCGPCSEIHINLGDDYDNPKYVNAGDPKCIEIWNLVFIQYNRDENGILHDLPAKHVDTGMGFERVCAVLQNKKSNYDTDVFTPIINAVSKLSSIDYDINLPADDNSEKGQSNIAMRVIADHIRTLTFAIADGATPGNEGRGYVLRRLLRRAARYGRKINLKEPFLYKLVEVVVENFGHVFPEVKTNKSNVERIIKAEEESFNATLDRGIDLFEHFSATNIANSLSAELDLHHRVFKDNDEFYISLYKDDINNIVYEFKVSEWNQEIANKYLKKKIILGGYDVFTLYDRYGFPLDLTRVMAKEKGFEIDEDNFEKRMNLQKEQARSATKNKVNELSGSLLLDTYFTYEISRPTEFTGYDELKSVSKIVGIKNESGKTFIVLDKSPFYVESGGQVDDLGKLIIAGKELNVIDVAKVNGQVIHIVENDGSVNIDIGTEVVAEVDSHRRWDIMRNHSATHFLHKALRTVLGQHVQQSGSLVEPERLRFDFSHFEKVSNEQLEEIEKLVNEKLRESLPLNHHRDTPFDEAKKMGALMFFGDKYGEKVNVVQHTLKTVRRLDYLKLSANHL